MWTEQSRGRMAKIAEKTKRYPSDLTDEEWAGIAPLMPRPGRRGRPWEVELREVIGPAAPRRLCRLVRDQVLSLCRLADWNPPISAVDPTPKRPKLTSMP